MHLATKKVDANIHTKNTNCSNALWLHKAKTYSSWYQCLAPKCKHWQLIPLWADSYFPQCVRKQRNDWDHYSLTSILLLQSEIQNHKMLFKLSWVLNNDHHTESKQEQHIIYENMSFYDWNVDRWQVKETNFTQNVSQNTPDTFGGT